MRTAYSLLALSCFALSGCSTTQTTPHDPAKTDPETVLISYHVKLGKEAELQAALSRAWKIYRSEHFVFAEPHIVIRESEDGNKTRFVEILTWVSRAIPEHAPKSVKAIWEQEELLCEERGGHYGIEPGEV